MRILAIETSCDETGIALVEATGGLRSPRFKIIKNLISSQIKIHRPFGGVVPNIAKREHERNLPILLGQIFGNPKTEQKLWKEIDLIAVTASGPGLEPALWAGIGFAKKLAKEKRKPVVGASHLEGHLYSFLLPTKKTKSVNAKTALPAVTLSVSGGHTFLIHMKTLKEWKKLGETLDDAVGEAFDKVARMLDLPYPGGPELEKLASLGNPNAIAFPRPMINRKGFDFSFSGLKTSVLYYLRDNPKVNKADVAASFQQAAIDTLVKKTADASKTLPGIRSIVLCGGVAANKLLRKTLAKKAKTFGLKFFVPDFEYNTDNATMIAAAAYFGRLRKKKYRLVAQGNPNI